jgi:ABC transporter
MAKIELKAVRKIFDSTEILKGIDLAIEDGEFIALIGPSGCGKSTLLRVIAGLEPQTSGEVRIGDVSVDGVRPSARNLAMVFQSYALYPHLTVFDNIAVPAIPRLRARPYSAGSCPDAPAPNAGSARRSSGLPLSLNFQVCSGASRDNCRAASGSALQSDAPSSVSRSGFCSTSRCPTWTPSCACICAPNSPSCIAS